MRSLFPSCTAAQASPRVHLNSASTRLLLNDARPPCLTCGSCQYWSSSEGSCESLTVACWLLAAGSTSDPSALSHLKHVTCSKYAPSCSGPHASASHCCSAASSGFDRACIRPRPSWTFGCDSGDLPGPFSSTFSLCGTSSGTSAHASLSRCLVTLGRSQQHSILVRLLLAMLFYHGSLGPNPGCFLYGPLGPNPCLFFLLHVHWHMFHPPHPRTSMPTSPSESPLLFNPWNQLNSDVTGFGNTQASRGNRNNRIPRTPRCPLNLRHLHNVDDIGCHNLQHLTLTQQSFSRASQ